MSYDPRSGGNGIFHGDGFYGRTADVIPWKFNNEPMYENYPPAQSVEIMTDSMNCLQLTNAMVIITFFCMYTTYQKVYQQGVWGEPLPPEIYEM